MRRIGRWVDFDSSYKTMDSTYMESVWWGIKQIWDKGLVYEGRKGSAQGPRKVLQQRLRIPDPARPGEMQVSFLPLVWLDYRLIYMDEGYRFMLVTGSTRNYLWLMGRDPKPGPEDYARLVARAAAMGFEVSRLERVPQG